MKTGFFILFLVLLVLFTNAQQSIHGFVKDKKTNEPLIGASLNIAGTNIGVATNNSGYFLLRLPGVGTATLTIRYIGYKTKQVQISSVKDLPPIIYLEPGINLNEVTVKASVFSEKQLGANITEIPVSEIAKMPSLLGEVDLLRAYQLLPGVQGGGEGKAGMFVRGGGPGQNLVMLDGSPLYYVNHIGGFASIFDPEAVKNFKLYKGGFPARFGGRLSSVLDVQMKEGNKNNKQTFISIGIMSGRFSKQGPVQHGKGSYFISLRRMWLDLLMRPLSFATLNNSSIGYGFYDFNSKLSLQITPNDKVFLSMYSGDDKLGLYYKDKFFGANKKSSQKVKWGNLLGVARWNHIYKPGLMGDIKLSFTKYRFKDNDFYIEKKEKTNLNAFFKSRIYDFGLTGDFEYFVNNVYKLQAGAGITFHTFLPGINEAVSTISGQTFIDSTYGSTSVFALEEQMYFENQFSLKRANFNFGGRLVHFVVSKKNYVFFEPRFSAGIQMPQKFVLKTSYTEMHQFVNMLTNPTAGFSTDFWLPATKNVPPSNAKQFSVGLEKNNPGFEAGIDLYYKKMNNLISFKEGEVFQGSAIDWQKRIEKNGVGTSKGLEFFVRKKTGKLTGWISYTLSKSDRRFENINFGKTYPFKYDRTHDFNIVVNFPINRFWNFSTTWVYGSGYPITLALGKMNVIDINHITRNSNNYYSYNEEGEYYGSKNGFRMKDYHRLDIGFTHTTKKKGKERIWTIGIYNAYNRQNPNYYFYKEKKPWRGDYTTELYQSSFLPIIPAVSYSVRF